MVESIRKGGDEAWALRVLYVQYILYTSTLWDVQFRNIFSSSVAYLSIFLTVCFKFLVLIKSNLFTYCGGSLMGVYIYQILSHFIL